MKRPLERALRALETLPAGDLAAREHVRAVRAGFAEATDDERIEIFRLLDTFDADEARIARAQERVSATPDHTGRRLALAALRDALAPARDNVFRHLAADPGSLALLVEMRGALLGVMAARPELASLAALDADLRTFLAARFDLTLLELRRLTWRDSAALLERLANAEAVHAVRGWFDLKDRLDTDRRVYAFFHPALPDAPLVFTEVALVDEPSSSIRAILNPKSPLIDAAVARCAVFYSISNCEPGLTGIPLGNALIKHAVETLRTELPRLRTFVTLSPLPGFAAWVRGIDDVPPEVRAVLATPGWHRDPLRAASIREPLLRLAARYVANAKRGDGLPADAVARFHLANGAIVDRLNFLADPTERGLKIAYGMMVNYRYQLDRITANQLIFATERRVQVSPVVRALLPDEPEAPLQPIGQGSRRRVMLETLRRMTSTAPFIRARRVRGET